MGEDALTTKHLNEFNSIANQLSLVEINFDDEACPLILLAPLPNSWEPMRTKNDMANVLTEEV